MLNPGSLRLVRKYPGDERNTETDGDTGHTSHLIHMRKNIESDKSATSTQCWLGSDAFLAVFAVMSA